MLRYILRRLLLLIPLLLAASAIIFLLLRLGAGDPALDYLRLSNLPPTEEMVASTRELLGLNQPLAMQYLHWLWRALHLDFGLSYATQRPVLDDLLHFLPATLLLWGLLRASRHWPDAADPAITAYRTSDLRLTLWGCLLALLLFLLGSLLSTGLLLDPPQGMERSNFILLQIRQALHLLFRYLSLAGGAALLWLWYLRHRAPLTDERPFTLAVRWCAVWSVVGYLPSIIDFWSTLLAALLRSLHSGVPFDIMPQMNALILSVLAALAIISWSVFLYRPQKARNLVLQLLPWCFLIIRMAVPLTQLPRP